MIKILYPLQFFIRFSGVAEALAQDSSNMIDAATPPNGYSLSICVICSTGVAMLREEVDGKIRYRCTSCGQISEFKETISEAGQSWTNTNLALLAGPTN